MVSIRSLAPSLVAIAIFSACGATVSDGSTSPGGTSQTVEVTVQPATAQTQVGAAVAFTAQVSGAAATGVTWFVSEQGGGVIDGTGRYTPPAAPGTYHIGARANADPTVSGTATVTVRSTPSGGPLFPPDTVMSRQVQPALAEPALGATAAFADLGTTVTHVSDTRHHYAKDTPWNADETLALVGTNGGGSILDGTTWAPLRTMSCSSGHRTWSNVDPRFIYGSRNAANAWTRFDATTGTCTTLHTYTAAELGLGSLTSVDFGMDEGNMDDGDASVVLIANGNVPFVVDPQTGAYRCTVKKTYGTVYDTTMSHDGAYGFVTYRGSNGQPNIDAFDPQTCGSIRTIVTTATHWDACVDAAGEQVVALGDGGSSIYMVRASDGANLGTQLSPIPSRFHISCRSSGRPGWVYMSLYNDTCDSTLTNSAEFHRIFAVKLDGSQTVEMFAWDHEACPSNYDDDTMAVPSPLGNRVWWKARWDGTSSGIHSFVAERP